MEACSNLGIVTGKKAEAENVKGKDEKKRGPAYLWIPRNLRRYSQLEKDRGQE